MTSHRKLKRLSFPKSYISIQYCSNQSKILINVLSARKSIMFQPIATQQSSGVFSTCATGAMAPVILRKRLIAPAVSNHNGKILLTLGTRNIKILNTPLRKPEFIFLVSNTNMPQKFFLGTKHFCF